jgi:hypothetical protein
MERKNYVLTDNQLVELIDAIDAKVVLDVGGGGRLSIPDRVAVSNVWRRFGEEMGFDHTTVMQFGNEDPRAFSAVPMRKKVLCRPIEKKDLTIK